MINCIINFFQRKTEEIIVRVNPTATIHEVVEWRVRPNGNVSMYINHYADEAARLNGEVIETDTSIIQRPANMMPASPEFGDPSNNAWKNSLEYNLVNNIKVVQITHPEYISATLIPLEV